jgi:hypothetical protein
MSRVVPRIAEEASRRSLSVSFRDACSLMPVKYAVATETVMIECGSMKMSQAVLNTVDDAPSPDARVTT